MPYADVVVQNPTGLHARPAQKIVKLCGTFQSDVRIVSPRGTLNPKSIFSIMTGAIKQGDSLRVEAEGEDAEEAVAKISEMIRELED